MRISKVYTRSGDEGSTSLFKAGKVSKTHPRIQAGGAVDELVTFTSHADTLISSSISTLSKKVQDLISSMLGAILHDLFTLNGAVTCPESSKPGMIDENTKYLEESIDKLSLNLPRLSGFVLPGGSRENTALHICRTICRRTERDIVKLNEIEKVPAEILSYINRLSDLFFVMARYVNVECGIAEKIYTSNPLKK